LHTNQQRYKPLRTFFLLLSWALTFCACNTTSTPKPEEHQLSEKFYQNLLVAFSGHDYQLVHTGLDKINEAGIADKRTRYLEAMLALIERKPDVAVTALQDALVMDPEFGEAHNTLGTIYMQQKKYDLAETEFLKACDSAMYQTPEKAYQNLGNLYCIQKKNRQAQGCYLEAIKLRPGYFPPHYELSRLYLQTQRLELAADEIEKARQINSEHPGVWLQIGKIEKARGNQNEAIKAFEKVMKLQPAGKFADLANQEIESINKVY
jgi:type IV pilus assembly protein PilF